MSTRTCGSQWMQFVVGTQSISSHLCHLHWTQADRHVTSLPGRTWLTPTEVQKASYNLGLLQTMLVIQSSYSDSFCFIMLPYVTLCRTVLQPSSHILLCWWMVLSLSFIINFMFNGLCSMCMLAISFVYCYYLNSWFKL